MMTMTMGCLIIFIKFMVMVIYIYRYGVMGDDREALEMLGEEVTSSVKHRIVNKTKLSNNICDRCLCLHRLLYG